MDARNMDARIKDAHIGDIRIEGGRTLIADRLEDTTIRVSGAEGLISVTPAES